MNYITCGVSLSIWLYGFSLICWIEKFSPWFVKVYNKMNLLFSPYRVTWDIHKHWAFWWITLWIWTCRTTEVKIFIHFVPGIEADNSLELHQCGFRSILLTYNLWKNKKLVQFKFWILNGLLSTAKHRVTSVCPTVHYHSPGWTVLPSSFEQGVPLPVHGRCL